MTHKRRLFLLPDTKRQEKWGPVVVALMVLISGCETVMVPVSGTNDSPLRLSIAVGDTVRVLTKYGDRPTFEVTDITEDSLIGRDQNIRYDDMAFVERRSREATAGNALAVILVIAAGAVAVEGLGEMGAGFPNVQ